MLRSGHPILSSSITDLKSCYKRTKKFFCPIKKPPETGGHHLHIGGDGRTSSSQKISRLILWVDNFSTCPYFKRSQNGCQSNLYKNISCQIDHKRCYPGYHTLPDDHPDCPLSAQLSFNGRHCRHTRRIQQTEHKQAYRRKR